MKKKTSSSISLRTWIRNTHWKRHLRDGAKTIVQSPVNFLVFFLALNVVVWGAFLVLLLSKAVQLKGGSEQQGLWIEICGQTINGIFTLAAVPVHPKRFMGLVRALAIWRREKGIRTQFLSLFLEQHHQARLGQEEHEGVATTTTTCCRTLKESEEELLEMIDYFNAFPEYGHDRATATAAAAHDTPTRMDEATTIKVSPQGHDGEPTLAPSYTNTNTSTSTPYYSTSPNQEPNEDDSLRQQPSQQQQQQQQQPQATAAAPPSLSRQPTTTTLQIDIPEQELDNLLAHETQRVVHSCVLSYLPLTPTINPDQGPTLGAFADDGNATATTTTTTTPTTEPSTPLSLSSSNRTQSNMGRRSTRTRARTRTMTMKDGHIDHTIIGTPSAGTAGATAAATTTAAAAVGTTPGGRHSGSGDRPARGSFQRRPTYVVRETSEALLSHKDRPLNGGGALQEKEKEKGETPEISATTTLVEEEGHDRYNNDNDTSSSSSGGGSGQETTEPIVCLEPLPLTPEQVAWLDERQRGLVERKARLQQSWPWYTYRMPAGVEPVDFMAACQSFLSSSTSLSATKRGEKGRAAPLSSLSSSSSTSPKRMKLIQSPTKQLQMRASKACLILLSFNLNSMIQEVLCGFMWGWHYSTRPVAVVGAGVASGCLTALIPTIVIFLHERRLSKVRVVASTEEAIQEVIDAHPQK
ncbi:hypothetical protein DFQ26_009652 [Actinomortierella ambigua]|nr:hypothetical protein DFQ26_009652 [Actinomortierella ambigua]